MDNPSKEEMAELVLEKASEEGASYCEVRIERFSNETINVEGKLLKSSFDFSSNGAGIRVIADGGWGFSSTTRLVNSSLKDAVEHAVRVGRSAGVRRKTPVTLRRVSTPRDNIATKVRERFSDVDFKDKVDCLVECNARLRASNEVIKTTATMVEVEEHKYIATSEGTRVDFRHSMAFSNLFAFGFSSGVSELASLEVGGSGGYEAVEPSLLINSSEEVGKRVIHLLKAKACPKIGETQIVMDPSFLALLVHEIIGHPSEADRVLGWENAWGGGAWWKGMLGQRIGSELLSAVDEGGIERSLGYTPYDDEGVKCTRTYLIKEGKLVGHIQSRQTADEFNVDATGGMRAFSFDCIPMIRMSNTFILGGGWKDEEIVRETKDGILVRYYVGPSIDDKRFRWTITPQEAYRIKNGEIGEIYRGAVVMGTAPEFFKSIDALGQDVTVLPVTGCGKGDPEQLICVGNGGPTLRSRVNIVPRGD